MPFFLISVAAWLLLSIGETTAAGRSPLEDFAQRDAIRSVRLSPDGKRLLKIAVPDADGAPVLEIYDTDDLAAEPRRKSARPWDISAAEWAGDDLVVIDLHMRIDDDRRGSETRIALFDLSGESIDILEIPGALLENILPQRPEKIIVSSASEETSDEQLRLPVEFRPHDYYEVDLGTGVSVRLVGDWPLIGSMRFDELGSPWLARGFDGDNREYVWSRHVDGEWREIFRQHEDSHEYFDVYGPDPDNPDYVIVGAHNGHDKIGVWALDARDGGFAELIYRRNDVDVAGVLYHSNRWTGGSEIAGIEYFMDKHRYEYFDEMEAAGYEQLGSLIGNAYRTSITSRSEDGDTMIVWNEAPSDPGSLYLVRNALLKRIASRQPALDGKLLAAVEYITYETRDNREIAAFLTRPRGEAPHPLVVMPHDGPFETQVVVYDAWAQMLADNGYLVLQPQFRGSRGYGVEYWQAALVGGSQGGYRMQDDKDDGAHYLVRQGMADRDRIAMFGWGYGGYAALVAASRKPQIYRCVAAAASIPDTATQLAYYREHTRGHAMRQNVSFWLDSINPLDEVEQVNVPMLLIHGSDDRRVPAVDVYRYVEQLAKAGKHHVFIELDGVGHSAETLSVKNTLKMYQALIEFLADDCF